MGFLNFYSVGLIVGLKKDLEMNTNSFVKPGDTKSYSNPDGGSLKRRQAQVQVTF